VAVAADANPEANPTHNKPRANAIDERFMDSPFRPHRSSQPFVPATRATQTETSLAVSAVPTETLRNFDFAIGYGVVRLADPSTKIRASTENGRQTGWRLFVSGNEKPMSDSLLAESNDIFDLVVEVVPDAWLRGSEAPEPGG
jgi:hypothetical protein